MPGHDDFYLDVQANGINPDDAHAMNSYLGGLITTMTGGDFIHRQLDRISNSVIEKRASADLITAQATMFRGLDAGRHPAVASLPLS